MDPVVGASGIGRRVYPTNPYSEFLESELEQPIAARFEKQVERHPHRLAVQTRRHSLTYDGLNRRANRLARSISKLTKSSAGAVAILLDHDAPLVAAILAVLKSSRFYVVLEPSLPLERLRLILEDSQADLIVTDTGHFSQGQSLASARCSLLDCDTLGEDISDGNLELDTLGSSLAYLIYTSGSTGKPKGVCQTQRNVLHHTRKYTNACHLSAGDRFALLALCSFSASVSNLFGALLNGAALFPFKVREEGISGLMAWLRMERISIYHSVPLVFRNLASALTDEAGFPDLRLVKLGGEAITRADCDLFKRHFSERCLLYIGLGASEMNCIRYWLLDHQSEFDGVIAPVGFPVEDTEVLLLDEKQNEVSSGEVGEIAIRSGHLFPGYWCQPELTRAAFIVDPAGSATRVFRTGDLGRFLLGGQLQHLGRSDQQAKIRGVRIHTTEIEIALRNQTEVDDCAVLAEDERLVAYLTSRDGDKPDAQTLGRRLAESLPDYMIPSRFVWLAELPLTNGKIDRKALPKLSDAASLDLANYLAPRNELEEQLVAIWQKVLRQPRIGIRDNFFELGGHSLLAGLIAVELEKLLGRKVPLTTVFWSPTVESLAEHLARQEPAPRSSLVNLQQEGTKPPLFIIHGWGGDVYFFHELAKLLPDRPTYGLQAVGLDGMVPRHTTVEEMAEHYVREVRALQPEGPYYLTGYSLGSLVAFEMARQFYQLGQRVEFLGLLDPPIRPAPWWTYARTVAPILWPRVIFYLKRWLSSGGRESLHLKRRWKNLRRWIAKNRTKSSVALAHLAKTSARPEVPGFRDYYSAVAWSYRLCRYPGFIDVIVSDSHPKILLQLWRHLSKTGARFHRVPGSHRQMIERAGLPVLAEALQSALEFAEDDSLTKEGINFSRVRSGHPEFCMESKQV